ncbi:hypothetical protein Tcan_11926 [Toxocara canis]|uniref:UPAR/Ly6 domain-containing protein n=1 Tax=Toxocara canis TaxID=6265 RepID=A0A0B2VD02_TOXCA|nr:hypothetical protein Tcan_11926 [Toxocara canis]
MRFLHSVCCALLINFFFASSMYSCYDGFVGRIRHSSNAEFHYFNETRMCAAKSCIHVTLYNAVDRQGTYRQGISMRCAYTGGDRNLCGTSNCTELQHYNGMRGKFSFCCCEGNGCNIASESSLLTLYAGDDPHKEDKVKGTATRSFAYLSLFIVVFCLL